MEKIKNHDLKFFVVFSIIILYFAAFICDRPMDILLGMKDIIFSRDVLMTDYFALAGSGAAFFNAAVVLTMGTTLVIFHRIPFTGPTLAALFIDVGYGLWGKNMINTIPILLGVYLYAKLHKMRFGRHIYTALYGTCLAPFVTEMVYWLPFSTGVNVIFAILMGLLIGYLLPPLSAHTASMHMGYNLFNIGFSAGIIAFVLVCVLRSLGMENEMVFLWAEGRPIGIIIGLYIYFSLAVIWGLIMSKGRLDKLLHIFRHPGRAVADFVLMDGPGATLMNMGLIGIIGTTYIILIGGDFSGPVVGGLLMSFGFAAFGAHIKNYLPVLIGVYLFTFVSKYQPNEPGIQLAALFGVGLAPIAGQFGIFAGMLAGILHSAVVMCTSEMYGGLNLYNNGFSAGWVAIFMIPTLESFIKRFESHKSSWKNRKKKDGVS